MAVAEDITAADERPVDLEKVRVHGTAPRPSDATTGYKPDTTRSTGPWGDRNIKDVPYSITVLPEDLIENVSARNVDQLFKVAPLVEAGQSQDVNNIVQATVRGFNVARAYVNGVQNNNLGMGVFVEEIGQLEIIGGLSGFMYGASPVGGTIHYQVKRPDGSDIRKVTVGDYGGGQYYVHADLGGSAGPGNRFGYRFNLLKQDGDTQVYGQSLDRGMLSGSMDWRPTDDLVLQLAISRKRYELDGRQFQFFLGGAVPDPLDGTRFYGPEGTFLDVDSKDATFAATYNPSDATTVRAAYQWKEDTRAMVYALGGLLENREQVQFGIYGGKNGGLNRGGYVYLDSAFSTGPLRHALTIGVNGYKYENRLAILPDGGPSFFTPPYTVNLSDLADSGVRAPDWDLDDSRWMVNARSRNYNLVIGDDIRLNDEWSLMAGINRSTIQTESFSFASGEPEPGSRYDESATTPTASLLYRPNAVATTYATYIESLEQGAIVGPGYVNAGEILAPLSSRQYELGAKIALDRILLAAALFQIDKGLERSDDDTPTGTYVQDGRQIHRGLELSATGKVSEDITVMAGLALMDNEVKRSSNPSTEGKRPTWVAEDNFKVYTEYSPAPLPGWTLTAGAYFTGSRYQDSLNTTKVPGYTLFDIGFRLETRAFGQDASLRLNLLNATDRKYWAATSPGAPRTIAFSATIDF